METAEEERGSLVPRCAQPARQAQPVFGEVADSEFQEAITLVETSFLWPGLVTWLVETNGRQGHRSGPARTGAAAANLCFPQRLKGEEEAGQEGGHLGPRPPHCHNPTLAKITSCTFLPCGWFSL